VEDARLKARQARPARRCEGRSRPHRCVGSQREDLPVTVKRVAVVTGASSGIGEAIARALAADGWQLVLLARRVDRLQALAQELGGEFEACDVADREAVERVASSVLQRHPVIHLLVNNAGMPARSTFTRIEPERLEEVIRVNYLGSVWILRAFLPGLEAAGQADVVNIVSVAGTVAFAPAGPYSASKHAQLAFSRATTGELRARGIRVHTINPGFVETEGFPQATKLRSALLRRIVIGPEDVARHVLKTIRRNKRETFVPGYYRVAAIAQAVVPGIVARFAARSGYRR
jgi:uncharacterized protein